ncbi:hypothetical protein HO173_003589 [Letharia columbiana]|uniref:Uncharacterized protein n=1 Tax=Letharia columbiana TaxID=112416 RepID=A0A8H6L779_9LECA|nr:uncharacterized protein HO173_003589 [Letharia columbiana]KAF6238309.1 hypothetical protein HO173_003589 [Letharia columbiana]
MHLRTSTSAILLCCLLSLFAGASAELIPRNLDLIPRQASASFSPSATAVASAAASAAFTAAASASGVAQGGGENNGAGGGQGGGEGGASGGGSNPVIAAGSMGVTSASSKAGAAPKPTGEVNARALAMGAAGLIVGML